MTETEVCPNSVQRVHDLSVPVWRTSCHAGNVTPHPPGARVDASDTFKELQELRRGRGLDAHDLHSRVGPHIRLACGITETDGPAVVRRKVLLTLTELCSRLPDDLRLVLQR